MLHRLLVAVLLGLLLRGAPVLATCGSANCFLVTGTQEGVGGSGILTIDLSYRYIQQSRRLSGTKHVDEVLTPKIDFENEVIEPDHHREISTQNTLMEIDLGYGLTPRLTLAGSLPIVNQRDHEHWDDVGSATEHFTRTDGTSGFGDVRLGARYALIVKTKDLLVGGLGVKLPTGAYRLLDSEGAINEPTIQPGTGSTDAIVSLHYAHQIAPMRVECFLSGAYRMNRKNPLEYRMGDESLLSAGYSQKVGDRLTWLVQVNARRTERDRYLGQGVPSTGATFIDLTPGLRLADASGATSLYGFVQVPVRQDVNEVQLAPGLALLVGLSRAF